eukprot:TRINITY_DN333_c0_g1_i1.p1 TRINITY_DN333_c0_g1~~TRINITY_DN333_c0_g1_i1.p1  ORF type:complete len:372 (+),score=105.77 TRINITY_DN333_c0_g1_i1:358-1473(+)
MLPIPYKYDHLSEEIVFELPEGVTKRDIKVTAKSQWIKVTVKNMSVVEGTFQEKMEGSQAEYGWTMNGNKVVIPMESKSKQLFDPNYVPLLIVGSRDSDGQDVDVSKIDPCSLDNLGKVLFQNGNYKMGFSYIKSSYDQNYLPAIDFINNFHYLKCMESELDETVANEPELVEFLNTFDHQQLFLQSSEVAMKIAEDVRPYLLKNASLYEKQGDKLNTLKYYKRAMEEGSVIGTYKLAISYLEDEENSNEGVILLQKLMENNIALGYIKMAELCFTGEVINQDLESAVQLYEKAVEIESDIEDENTRPSKLPTLQEVKDIYEAKETEKRLLREQKLAEEKRSAQINTFLKVAGGCVILGGLAYLTTKIPKD